MFETMHPSLKARKIIHVDMDCFFAAVEIRDNPSLLGQPVIVGGNPKSRGVVCTCSYEARKYGIRSAMSCAQAYRLCPSAVFLPPNFEKYKRVSEQIRSVFKLFTNLVEPVSLDEAYLDVTNHDLYATKIAVLIREEIFAKTSLTASAGVAPNKLIAKIASDLNKPNGLAVVQPRQVPGFMEKLPLRRISGIGPATEHKLHEKGLRICSDVWPLSIVELEAMFGGRLAGWLYARSRGIDERPVKVEHIRKSLGSETTFPSDVLSFEQVMTQIGKLSHQISKSMQARGLAGRTLTLKIKYADFKQITRSKTVTSAIEASHDIFEVARNLIVKTEVGKRPIRLVGIAISKLES
ncbi:MAG: DNA polymerase IV [Bdellovibrionota bacterium]